MNTEKNFNSIEDMVKYVLENTYRATIKWTLKDRTDTVWVNEEEGKAWDKENDAIPHLYRWNDIGCEPAATYYNQVAKELQARKPAEKKVTRWWLEEQGRSYRPGIIHLTEDLAGKIDQTWKRGPTYRGSNYAERKGAVTIPGILKRLGKTDIAKEVKTAEEKAKAQQEKNGRNYLRREVNELAKKIQKILVDNPGLILPAYIAELSREDFLEIYGEK